MKDDTKEKLSQELSRLEKLLGKVDKSLKKAPEGRVRMAHSNGSTQFYLCEEGKRTNGRYAKKSEYAMVKKLLQKEYDKKLKSSLVDRIKVLKYEIKHDPQIGPEEIFESFPEAKKRMITPYLDSDRMFAEAWIQQEAGTKGEITEEGFYTERGELVRSKSEKMIADKLAKMGIPYRYEAPLTFRNGRTIYPDFTILDIENRREIYLEHLGMMDNSGYAEGVVVRLGWYAENGIFPGKGLLLTFETLKTPLNVKVLEKMLGDLKTFGAE